MKRKIVPLLLAGVLTLGAVPARAVSLPMFKQEATVTISREEYESLQKYQKLETLLNVSMQATQEDRAKSPDLSAGVDEEAGIWEIIVKYT